MRLDFAPASSLFVRHKVAFAAAALCGALALALLVVGPLVIRSRIQARAARAQAVVDVTATRLGWGAIWLRGVKVSVPALPGVTLELDSVKVVPTWSGGVRSLDAAGGSLEVTGTLRELEERWRKWRGEAPTSEAGPQGSGAQFAISGLAVHWKGLLAEGSELHVWGARAERGAQEESLAVDLVRLHAAGALMQVDSLNVIWGREGSRRVLQGLKAGSVTTHIDPQTLAGPPFAVPLTGTNLEPHVTPTVEAASPLWEKWRVLRARAVELIKQSWSERASLEMPRVQTQLKLGEQTLNVGPARCTIERDGSLVRMRFVPDAQASRETVAFKAELPLDAGPAVVSFSGGPVGLDALGVREGDLGLQRVRDIRLSLRSVLKLPDDQAPLEITAEGQLENLSFFQPKLAAGVVDAERIGWSVRAGWNPSGHEVKLEEVRLELGEIKSALRGVLHTTPGNPAAQLNFEMPLVSCQSLFDSVPSSLLPGLGGTRLKGTFSLSAALELEVARLSDMKFDWSLQNDCYLTAVREDVAPARFKRPFQYPIRDGVGTPLVRESGPMSRDWVPAGEISPYLETAAIICEDSRFFSHKGIDEQAIEKALVANVQAGRFVRGASTISMQLAKNLYLNHEKTLSRKLQEALLTVLLEQELSKEEILELYFNVIEFGPDVWGIRAAADYYFGVEPSQLSLAQALYLGSILPSPRESHAGADGVVSAKWMEYLHKLMHIAHKIKRIDDQELTKGLEETLTLLYGKGPPSTLDPPIQEAGVIEPVVDPQFP